MNTISVAPVFKVADLDAALSYYKDVLNFQESFRVDNYAGVKLGVVELHLAEKKKDEDDSEFSGGSTVYIYCEEIDNYYYKIQRQGAIVMFPPTNWPYGMRDFRVQDIDHNYISFGCTI